MNKPRQPTNHRHELRVVEREIEPDRQWDHPEKQLSHIGLSPHPNMSAKPSESVALSRMAHPTRMEGLA
jgi:hypothetical protein